MITIKTLGTNGRFGNQIFQRAFGLGFARKYGHDFASPQDWIGRKIWKILDEPIETLEIQDFPRTSNDEIPAEAKARFILDNYGGLDLFGYWQFQDAVNFYTKKDIGHWFQWQDWVKEIIEAKKAAKTADGTKIIAIHARRGDYVNQTHCYCNIKDESFLRAITLIPDHQNCRTIWLTEENPSNSYNIPQELSFIDDFTTMLTADYIIRSNSTFSLVAGWFSNAEIYSPVVGDRVGWKDVEFVKGNFPKCASSVYHPASILTDVELPNE